MALPALSPAEPHLCPAGCTWEPSTGQAGPGEGRALLSPRPRRLRTLSCKTSVMVSEGLPAPRRLRGHEAAAAQEFNAGSLPGRSPSHCRPGRLALLLGDTLPPPLPLLDPPRLLFQTPCVWLGLECYSLVSLLSRISSLPGLAHLLAHMLGLATGRPEERHVGLRAHPSLSPSSPPFSPALH